MIETVAAEWPVIETLATTLLVIVAVISILNTRSAFVMVAAWFVLVAGVALMLSGCSTVQHVPYEDKYVQEEIENEQLAELYCPCADIEDIQREAHR